MATTARIPIDIRRFPWTGPLVTDYAFEYGKVADFFAGNPRDPGAWRDAIARAQKHPRHREAIADILESQQRRRGAPPEARAAAARLRDPRTVAVLTGQQAGLFGGPLFALLKAITAMQLAERVAAEHQVPAVAIFWIEADDHDWDEVKSCGVLDAAFARHAVSIGDPPGAHRGSVARVCLDGSIDRAIEHLASLLPATEFSPALFDSLRAAYRAGAGMADAFGQWMESLLGPRGLIVHDSADTQAKALAVGIFATEIERGGDAGRLAAEAGAAMDARGYHAPVAPQPGTIALFDLTDGRRGIRVHDAQAGRFEIDGSVEERDALLVRVRRSPAEFSPNVLLRPLVQDTLFPTVCYVAGPSELAYLGQLRGVYEAFGVPMPLVFQRATATLLDANASRFLQRHNLLAFEQLRPRDEAALNQLLDAQLPPGVEASLQEVDRALQEHMETLAARAAQIDATLDGATRSALGRMQDDLRKLHGKILQAAKRKDDTLRRQFQHAQAQAFPDGAPQERAIGFVAFLNKYGPALVDRLVEALPPEMGTHWVLTP